MRDVRRDRNGSRCAHAQVQAQLLEVDGPEAFRTVEAFVRAWGTEGLRQGGFASGYTVGGERLGPPDGLITTDWVLMVDATDWKARAAWSYLRLSGHRLA